MRFANSAAIVDVAPGHGCPAHDGTVDFESLQGRGASVRVRLPLSGGLIGAA